MSDDIRLLIAWSENQARTEIARITTMDALNAWIVANNQRLGKLEHGATAKWDRLRDILHAKDGELRAKIRQGVG